MRIVALDRLSLSTPGPQLNGERSALLISSWDQDTTAEHHCSSVIRAQRGSLESWGCAVVEVTPAGEAAGRNAGHKSD